MIMLHVIVLVFCFENDPDSLMFFKRLHIQIYIDRSQLVVEKGVEKKRAKFSISFKCFWTKINHVMFNHQCPLITCNTNTNGLTPTKRFSALF